MQGVVIVVVAAALLQKSAIAGRACSRSCDICRTTTTLRRSGSPGRTTPIFPTFLRISSSSPLQVWCEG